MWTRVSRGRADGCTGGLERVGRETLALMGMGRSPTGNSRRFVLVHLLVNSFFEWSLTCDNVSHLGPTRPDAGAAQRRKLQTTHDEHVSCHVGLGTVGHDQTLVNRKSAGARRHALLGRPIRSARVRWALTSFVAARGAHARLRTANVLGTFPAPVLCLAHVSLHSIRSFSEHVRAPSVTART